MSRGADDVGHCFKVRHAEYAGVRDRVFDIVGKDLNPSLMLNLGSRAHVHDCTQNTGLFESYDVTEFHLSSDGLSCQGIAKDDGYSQADRCLVKNGARSRGRKQQKCS